MRIDDPLLFRTYLSLAFVDSSLVETIDSSKTFSLLFRFGRMECLKPSGRCKNLLVAVYAMSTVSTTDRSLSLSLSL